MSTELVKVETFANHPALMDNFQEIIEENLGDEGLRPSDLTMVKMPTGGRTSFDIVVLGEEETRKNLTGIIIAKKNVRAYWKGKFGTSETGDEMPDCMSADGKFGEVLNEENAAGLGGLCKKCPMAAYKSAEDGKTQACKKNEMLYMLIDGELLPIVLRLSPGSLKNSRTHFVGLLSKNIPFWSVVTEVTLEKDKNDNGIEYSKAKFKVVGKVDAKTLEAVKEFKGTFKDSLQNYDTEDIVKTQVESTEDMIGKDASKETTTSEKVEGKPKKS